jgi:hypothetical protein
MAVVSLGAGCAVPVEEPGSGEPGAEGPLGEAASREIDPGMFQMTQGGTTVASAWKGTISSGASVEYWVAKAGYSAGAARTLTGTSSTCASWKSNVCGTSWAGSTYYQATYVETTLDCAFPPDPCQPPTGAVSFLANGSYHIDTRSGGAFAWTYVSGACEYWSMNHTVGAGTSTQSPMTTGWSSLSSFESAMCAKNPVPSTWYTVYYTPVANFCSASTC